MNVHIARDGVVIGEHPQSDLEELARAGELELTDHYWHEGMEDWLLLPELLGEEAWLPLPPPPPPPNLLLIAGIVAGTLLLIGLGTYYFIAPDRVVAMPASTVPAAPPPAGDSAEAALALRDKASADLRQRIERLPAQAAPPLNTFYYDVSVRMKKSFDTITPWSAEIRGGENVVNPETQNALQRTQFTLNADYRNGEWTYRSYRASTAAMDDFNVTQVDHNNTMPAPPSLVGILGLKNGDR